jgi:hypothetical protein
MLLLAAQGGVLLLQGEGLLLDVTAAATPAAGMATHAGLWHALSTSTSHL